MRPVDYAALRIPLIFATELDGISDRKSGHSTGNINVMCYQQRLPRCQPNYESLVPASVIIVRQDFCHLSAAGNLNITFTIGKSRRTHGLCRAARESAEGSGY